MKIYEALSDNRTAARLHCWRWAPARPSPASTGSSGSDSVSSAVSEPSVSVDKAELASLQEKLLEAQSQLSALQEENKKLLERLATLEESEGRPLTKRKLSNGATLTYEPGKPDGPVYSTSLANDLRVVYEDGEVEIGSGLSSVEVSPTVHGCCTIRTLPGSRSARSGCTTLKRAKSSSFPSTACATATRPRSPTGWTTAMCCLSSSSRRARPRSAATCACTIPRRRNASV